MAPDPIPAASPITGSPARRKLPWWWLAILPLLCVGPSLLPGNRFLPQHPASFPPLSIEDPARAAGAAVGANLLASDRVSPILTDWLAARASTRVGVAPLWDPQSGLGAPLAAGSIAGLFYPANQLNLILPPEMAGAWTAMLSLFLAGLGMWLLLGRVGLAGGPALVGALALQTGAFALVNLHYGVKVDAALWLPWSLWAAEGLARRLRGSGPWLFLFTALSFLAGFPPIALFASAAVLLHALGQSAVHARRRAAVRKESPPPGAKPAHSPSAGEEQAWGVTAIIRVAAWIVLGIAGAAVQLIPTAEMSLLSTRQGRTPADLLAESLPVATLANLPLADLFGRAQAPDSPPLGEPGVGPHPLPAIDPIVIWATPPGQIQTATNANPLEWNLYAGAILLILALAGILAAPGRAAPALLLLLASIGFAQGWPGLRLLYHLPGFNAGAPARALSIAWVAWPWLAALGAQALAAQHKRALKGALTLALLLAVAGLTIGHRTTDGPQEFFDEEWVAATALLHDISADDIIAATALPDSAPPIVRRLSRSARRLSILSGCGVLAVFASLLIARRTRTRSSILPFVPWLLLLGGDGLLTAREHLAPRPLGGPLFPDSGIMRSVALTADGGRVLRLDESASGIGDVLRLARPNMASAWAVKDLTPYAVFPNRRLVQVLTTIDPGSAYRTGASAISTPDVIGHPALDLFGVTCLLATREVHHPRLEPVLAREGFHVYRRTPPAGLETLSSAWVVPSAEGASSAVALGLVTSGQISPLSPRCIVPPEALEGTAAGPESTTAWSAGLLEFDRPAPDRIDLLLRASSGGWLVISEAWYPGWKATVNGEDVKVSPADHALMALPVPAGDAVVRLFYEPGSVRAGVILSVLATLFALFHAVRRRRPRPIHPQVTPDQP